MVDETKLNQFIGKILGDLGGAFSVRMGDKLWPIQGARGGGADDASGIGGKDERRRTIRPRMTFASGDFRLS